MPIAETRCWMIGPYSVQQRPRPDNPAWAVYIVFRGDKLIGKSFSVPDIGCCRWLQAHQNGQYALPAPERGRTEYGYCAGRRSRAQDNIYKARAFSRTARRRTVTAT